MENRRRKITDDTAAYFTGGGDRDAIDVEAARAKARELAPAHRDLGDSVLFSAAAYLLRDGRLLRDSAVLAEARRRKAHLDEAIARNERRFAPRSADASPNIPVPSTERAPDGS